jgi:hypothetical protein
MVQQVSQFLQRAAQRSRPVDNLLYLKYEFQPTSEARRPYGRQCGQTDIKSKVSHVLHAWDKR